MFRKIILGIFAMIGLFLTFGSEGAYESTLLNASEEKPTITLSHNSWDDGIGTTAVLANVLRDEGFEVELVQLDPAILFSSLATGSSDISVVPWEITHSPYIEEYEESIHIMGAHAEGAENGAVVPTYMEDINSIEDLTNEANRTLTSIEPGAVIVSQAEFAIEAYPNLEGWEVQTSSTGAMLTSLQQAYENKEEIVVTGWKPHWKFFEMDLKVLEDPESTFGVDEDILKISRIGFEEEYPVASEIIHNFSWSIDDMQQVMLYLQEDMTPSDAGRKWMEDNPEKVNEWTEGITNN